jgi:hypothetical protein
LDDALCLVKKTEIELQTSETHLPETSLELIDARTELEKSIIPWSRNKELEAMIKEMKQSSHKSSVSREDAGSDTET